jgi:hypothetical protein
LKQSGHNPLREELAQSQRIEPHPDADLLTALQEGSLQERERIEIMAHLAICTQCREIVSIATVVVSLHEEEIDPLILPRPARSPLRTWMPWVAAAASIAVVCAPVLVHQLGKPAPRTNESASISANTPALPPAAPAAATDQKLQASRSPEAKGEIHNSRKGSRSKAVLSPGNAAGLGINAAGRTEGNQPSNPSDTNQQAPNQSATIAAEAASAQGTPPQLVTPPKPKTTFHGSLHSAIGGARMMNEVRSADITHTNWRINDQGRVERSLNGGEWQVVLAAEKSKMRVVSVFDREVWVGGESLDLFYSIDDGTTWVQVNLPNKEGNEAAITHIRFQTQHSGTVDAEDGTSWSTSDGGKTWK